MFFHFSFFSPFSVGQLFFKRSKPGDKYWKGPFRIDLESCFGIFSFSDTKSLVGRGGGSGLAPDRRSGRVVSIEAAAAAAVRWACSSSGFSMIPRICLYGSQWLSIFCPKVSPFPLGNGFFFLLLLQTALRLLRSGASPVTPPAYRGAQPRVATSLSTRLGYALM